MKGKGYQNIAQERNETGILKNKLGINNLLTNFI